MHRPARALSSIVMALALAACQTPSGVLKPAVKPPAGNTTPKGGQLVGFDGATLIGMDGATLIGMDGASLIGPDGASLIGADGASIAGTVKAPPGLIGADGASIVAAGAGNLQNPAGGKAVSDMGGLYRLTALEERPLAGVHVYLRTAEGKFVVDKAGKPLTAVTDAKGAYAFPDLEAGAGLMVFVPAKKVGGEVQGLAGLRPKDAAADAPVAIDLASTLTTQWIFDRILAKQADRGASLDRLPAELAVEARTKVVQAVGERLPGGLAGLASKAFADALDGLRTADAGVGDVLTRVEKVMTLAGTDSTRAAGALAITLQQPVDVAVGPDDALFVAEFFTGVIRRIDPTSGEATVVVGAGSPSSDEVGALFSNDVAMGPDGLLYMTSKYTGTIYRCRLDGTGLEKFAGGDVAFADGMRALDAKIDPVGALAFGKDGSLYLAEGDRDDGKADARLFRVAPDGTIAELPTPWSTGLAPATDNYEEVASLAVGADGALWCLEFQGGALYVQEPGAGWRVVKSGLNVSHLGDLLPLDDGGVLVSMGRRYQGGDQTIVKVTRDGAMTPFAGSGVLGADPGDAPAATVKLADPAGLARRRDGTVIVADQLAGTVRAIGADGISRLVAGKGPGPAVTALAEPLNVPGGIAIDAKGQVVVTEYAGHAIRRIEGDRLVRIAGGEPGVTPAGGRADKLLQPTGCAFQGDDLIVVEQGTRRLLRLRPDGTIAVVAGGGDSDFGPSSPLDAPPSAARLLMREPLSVAVSPKDGLIYFTDRQRIWRHLPDGRLELVAGHQELKGGELEPEREGKPAIEVPLGVVAGITFDAAGNLYGSEVTSCRVFKIDGAGTFSLVAGLGLIGTFAKLDALTTEEGVPAKEAALVMPSGLAFDAAGNLYVTEIGTRAAQAFATILSGTDIPLLAGRVRKIDPTGRITTIAGYGGPSGTTIRNPIGVVAAPDGRVIFVDNGTNQVKAI
jgi:sugar lactone lactonase YvrE